MSSYLSSNGADLVLHYHPHSFHSQKVLMALHYKKIKFRQQIVDIYSGKQMNDKFLSLNPRGEVPVLVDEVRIIPDSEQIINYLEDNFKNGCPRLMPTDHVVRQRVEYLYGLINQAKVESVTIGTLMFDENESNFKSPFNKLYYRNQIKMYAESRPELLSSNIKKRPDLIGPLTEKLKDVTENMEFIETRDKYLDLLLKFESLFDECEAELSSHDDNSWWLCSSELSVADIALSILMHRMWQLGLEKVMWEKRRPFVKNYFAKIQHMECFKRAITVSVFAPMDLITKKYFLGALGITALAIGGLYLFSKYKEHTSIRRTFYSVNPTAGRPDFYPPLPSPSSPLNYGGRDFDYSKYGSLHGSRL